MDGAVGIIGLIIADKNHGLVLPDSYVQSVAPDSGVVAT
jgi:hypothetical protein